MIDRAELASLRAENARRVALLEAHGIDWRLPRTPVLVARMAWTWSQSP
jgi:hypothetical protein